MVPGADGQLLEQTFTVNIPVTEIREVDTKVPAGRKPITVPLHLCHFFDLNGQELSEADATERLQSLKPVFLLDGSEGELPEIPTIIKQVLKEDCLVIVTLQVIREPRPMMNRMLQLQPARALPAIQAIPAVPVLPPAQ